jgi:protocatechuate 3,4-dioxygenase beta subunit
MTRAYTRRQALGLLAGGAAVLSTARSGAQNAIALPQCVARPEQTEGPFFVDAKLHRSDIRADPATGALRPGVPLQVTFRVSRVAGRCTPLAGVLVDLWQCDAQGVYSGVRDAQGSSVGQRFLRGYQITDQNGHAVFTTVYPGCYRGRTVHLHFKLRLRAARSQAHEFTSQIYFDDAVTDRVLAMPPYSARGPRDRRNHQDGLFQRGGKELLMAIREDAKGYSGHFDIGLQLDSA